MRSRTDDRPKAFGASVIARRNTGGRGASGSAGFTSGVGCYDDWWVFAANGTRLGLAVLVDNERFYLPVVAAPADSTSGAWPFVQPVFPSSPAETVLP